MDANGHKVMTITFGSDELIRMINQTPTPIQPYNNNSNISVLQLMQKKKGIYWRNLHQKRVYCFNELLLYEIVLYKLIVQNGSDLIVK